MFAITTRNKLRSRRFALNMVWAWSHVRRQLERTPGMLAYTTGIASLTEFVTLSLWEKEIDMFLFMSSDDHLDMMWNFRHWTDSFWSMRWNATHEEAGAWDGRMFAAFPPAPEARYAGPGYLDEDRVPQRLKTLLGSIARPLEPRTLEVDAVIARIATRSLAEVIRLKRALRPWKAEPSVLRFAVAVGLGECMLVAAWDKTRQNRVSALIGFLEERFPCSWAMRFQATDFEVGHWDRLRFRDLEGVACASR